MGYGRGNKFVITVKRRRRAEQKANPGMRKGARKEEEGWRVKT